jgi:hypothetical protein
MRIIELKTVNPFFNDVYVGLKDFEVRKNDRDFKVGDRLKFIEHGEHIHYLPRYVFKDVKYILTGGQYGIAPDYVVLGLVDVSL